MWNYLIQVTLCMGLLYVPYHLWFKRETFFDFNRRYLLFGLVISAIVPILPRWIEVQEPVLLAMPSIQLMELAEITVLSASSSGWHWTAFVVLGYWIVVGLILFRLGRDVYAIWRMWRTGERHKLDRATLIIHPEATAPFSFFNAVFIAQGTREDEDLFNHVLSHELQHVRGRHSMDVLLLEILCAVFWISPLVYLYRRAVKNVHEFLADNIVSQEQRVDYAEILISQAHSGLRLSLTNQFFQSQLKSRIVMMMKEPSRRINKWKYLLALPVLALSVILFSFRNSEQTNRGNVEAQTVLDTVPQEIFKVVEEMPRFPGCEEKGLTKEELSTCAQKRMLEYIYQNIKYPADARKQGVNGRVVAQFVIERDGQISGVKVVRSIGAGCDDEVVRVLKSMNSMEQKWIPGRQRGKIVRVQYTIPVAFKLNGATEKTTLLPYVKRDVPAVDEVKEVFKVVEEMPRFPGCEDIDGTNHDKYQCGLQKMLEYIYSNLKYPQDARANKIEGRAVVQFVVEANGMVSSIKSVRELGYGCDIEVIRVVESMNEMPERWIAGVQRGKKVSVQLTLPVTFKL